MTEGAVMTLCSGTRDLLYSAVALLVLAGAAMIPSSCYAEEEADHGRVGLCASLQGSQTDILVPLWLNESIVVEPAVVFTRAGGLATDWGAGVLLRYNVRSGVAVPYVGFRVGAMFLHPKDQESTTDLVLGPVVGGEYFFAPQLSLGVEAQINFAISDKSSYRFGNPNGTNVNTATAVNVTFYF
jgi:hypothetical protein